MPHQSDKINSAQISNLSDTQLCVVDTCPCVLNAILVFIKGTLLYFKDYHPNP